MAIRLIRDNVERIVNDESVAKKLEAEGFKRVTPKPKAKAESKAKDKK